MKAKFYIFNFILIFVVAVTFMAPQHFARADQVADIDKTTFMTNNVVLIKFEDNKSFPNSEYLDKLDKMYNTSEVSMRNYFLQSSLNALDVKTTIISGNNAVIIEKPVEYFLPKFSEFSPLTNSYQEINPLGYDNRYFYDGSPVSPDFSGACMHIERTVREQELLREIISKISTSLINADSDNNGVIDSMTFIIDLDETISEEVEWNGILWPHMTMAYNLTKQLVASNNFVPNGYYEKYVSNLANDVYLDGLKVGEYNVLTTKYIDMYEQENLAYSLDNVGLLCHEFYHTLGLYDYYSYSGSDYESVGEMDILGITHPIPQMALTYNRQKLGWLTEGENILPIEKSGTYTLKAVTSEDKVKAYKLVLNDYAKTGEYFMIEMRSNMGGGFDSLLAESGIIIYRVNEKNGFLNDNGQYSSTCYGNMYTPKNQEEVYVYREGCGDALHTYSGDSLAILNGKTVIDGYTYKKDIFGTTDKTIDGTIYKYKPDGILGLIMNYYNTTVYYGDKSNTGIALSNITLSSDYSSATFTIEFDDTSKPVSADDSFTLSKTLDNKTLVGWESLARSGNVKILAVEYSDKLVDEKDGLNYAKILPSADDIKSGKMSGYNTVISKTTPISFKNCKLDVDKNCVIYALYSDGENEFVKFVGVVNVNEDISFLDVVFGNKFFKILIISVFSALICSIVCAILITIIKKRKTKNC